MSIVPNRKIWYSISGILLAVSLISFGVWGLNLGIDFKGGTIVEANYPDGRPTAEELESILTPLSIGAYSVRQAGESDYILRTRALEEPERIALTNALTFGGTRKAEIIRTNSVGPILGIEAARKSIVSIIFVALAIVAFITFAFRKVSEPVASWKYGVIALVALFHDVVIPTGLFSVLGRFQNVEVDTLFVTALLVILGFSVHDTIVVFDRVRENLRHAHDYREKKDFEVIVEDSVHQTFTRSINTSLTTVLALLVLYFFGAETTKHFSLALIAGIITGTYSSIFIASPLLVTAQKLMTAKREK